MNYESLLADQEASRKAFGAMLRSWRIKNKWTQYTACKWAKEARFEVISYGNLSFIEQGKAGELRQKAFFQLQELNRRIAVKDFGNVRTQEIKDKLQNAIPLVDDDGKPWDAVDFWACYVGLKPIPNS